MAKEKVRMFGGGNRKRAVVALLGLTLLVGLLALFACKRGGDGPAAGVQQDGDVTLTVWQTETDKGAVARLNETIAVFERENPGVKVKLESVAWSSLSSKLAVALQAHNEPDLTHLEPFMVAQLYSRDQLLPIDDLVQQLQADNGPIYGGVLNLQNYKGSYYGIAYAVGTTGFAYRKDVADSLGLKTPQKWADYVAFAKAMAEHDQKLKVLLPGGDPFFIDQLFAELVANNGGVLFDPDTYQPRLTSREVVETLSFLRDLSPYVDAGWQTQPYLDQFNRFARGEAGNVPVTYARAAKAIEGALKGAPPGSPRPSPDFFALMPQPTGPSYSGTSIATIDCEPYVIFKSAKQRKSARYGDNAELAKKFLRLFYSHEQYLPFVKEVPVHLTPIFVNLAKDPQYLNSPLINNWKPWSDQTDAFLADPARVRPILMPDVSEPGRALPFLLDFQSSRILTQAVTDVVRNHVSPEEAAKAAQERAEQLIETLGMRRWGGSK